MELGPVLKKDPHIACYHRKPVVTSGMYQITAGLLKSELKYDYNSHLDMKKNREFLHRKIG